MRARGQNALAAVVEADAEGQEQVRLVEQAVRVARAVHAQHAQEQRVVGREGAEPHQRRGDRDRLASGQAHQVGTGVGAHRPAADVEHRPLRRADHRHQLGHPRGAGCSGGRGAAGLGPGLDLDLLRLNVLRDVDQHRTGPARWRAAPPRAARGRRAARSCAW
jgi:hypothetical protein